MKKLLALAVVLMLLSGLIPAQAQSDATVMLGTSEALGKFLVDGKGMTLYLFTKDAPNVSNCYDQCAVNWPPLLVEKDASLSAGEGVPGKLGKIERKDGTFQVTYNQWPLYYWVKDGNPGDTTGHKVGDVWYVINPEQVAVGGNAELGTFLVGANGMTLYMFTKDTPGVSNCYDQCAANWPPLTLAAGEPLIGGLGIHSMLGTIERKDGSRQVTYNDMPLYFWAKDTQVGDATGQNVGEVWFVVHPPSVMVGENPDLGKFLVTREGMTLYTFANDKPGESACYDKCAVNWPPLMVVKGEVPVAGAGVTGKLGVIERTDGTFQVTVDDMPVYLWFQDVKPGDATGIGQVWSIIAVQ